MSLEMAQLLFKDVTITKNDLENKYKPRENGKIVTRFAPSPTGFLHIGGVYTSLICRKMATQNNGVFMLRIEDTDKKREVIGSKEIIINVFKEFGVKIDEGPISTDAEIGEYGPYIQSNRKDIYQALAKELVIKDLAYPCFLTEEELSQIHEEQVKNKLTPGLYKEYAKYRDITYLEAKELINQNKEYVLRFKVPSNSESRIMINDLIRGEIEMENNLNDFVLLKSDGIPTYHFAHACDDHLMRTTHVIRGEEWISSLPIHLQLFNALEFELPKYAHVAPVMKQDLDSRRKLSKRKDPESSAEFYLEKGYPIKAIYVYLYTLINSNFEEWYLENKNLNIEDFEMKFSNMSNSGPLYDLEKLNSISSEVIFDTEIDLNVLNLLNWAKKNDIKQYERYNSDLNFVKRLFQTQGPLSSEKRKDLYNYSMFMNTFSFFYDDIFINEDKAYMEEFNTYCKAEDKDLIINSFIEFFIEKQNGSEKTLKDLSKDLNYTDKKKYQKNPEMYRGVIMEFYHILRMALSHKSSGISMDDIIDVLGYDKVIQRLKALL